MKRKALFSLLALIFVLCLVGCDKTKKEKSEKTEELPEKFTIVCTSKKETDEASETENVYYYTFDKEQYATSYKFVTNEQFFDEVTYKTFKKAQEDAIKEEEDDKETKYDLRSDDKNLKLVLTMNMDNLDASKAENEKEEYKAKNILNDSENEGLSCILDGIQRSQLK